MKLKIYDDKQSLSQAAAEQAATAIRKAIVDHGQARIVAATAASQIVFLDALTQKADIDWARVEVFHLDEYGRAADHASGQFSQDAVGTTDPQNGSQQIPFARWRMGILPTFSIGPARPSHRRPLI
ncbi:MAG TPA: 6-phosphogluconolactonase [Edaphobacter sp.]|nr:6-phosphogluconolactonase [Edaphobacter sp.]